MTESEIQALIAQAKAEEWTELDLSGCYLTAVPEAVQELPQLETLNLGRKVIFQVDPEIGRSLYRYNYLTELPEWMAQLSNLQSLYLSGNNLTELPEWMAQLSNLQSLYLSGNNLTELPEWMAQLSNLHSLHLSGNNLTELPEWMAQLSNLQSLYLSGNKLTELPEWMAQLSNLHSLHLSGNNLTELPEWMAQLSNLHSLHLSGNNLTELPEWMAQLSNLHSLHLSGNNLTELPEWMAQLSNLQSLDLFNNNLTELPEWMTQLSNLQSLYFRSNNLTELPEWMTQLSNLQSLYLRSNNLTELPEWMAQLTNLQSLYFRSNNLTELPEWMAQLSNLQSLYLSYAKLTELPEWMAQLSNLQSLYLRSTNLTELPEWMAQLTNLQSLDLSRTNLTEFPEWMAQLTNLHTLHLSGTNLTELPGWIAQLTNLHTLHFSGTNLTELPEWMAQLTNLHSLTLSGTNLTELPEWMAQLTNLHTLYLGGANLTELPEWMAQLTNLHSLTLSENNLAELPEWMAQLTNLHSLDLSENNLAELPEWMAQLTNLRTLNLSENGLGSLSNLHLLNLDVSEFDELSDKMEQLTFSGLPKWITQLSCLHTLDLSENYLAELPEWMADNENLPQLRSLYIGQNPLTIPPAEVLGSALINKSRDANISAIRNYFRQLLQGGETYIYEAKLLIIGEGRAGKTSLARKLLNPACDLLADEESTEGIDILPWNFDLPSDIPKTNEDDQYTANIWDFGGQEIYFATHQFFLTKRSVYLLVADTRRQHTDFYDWLRMQETFGDNSPVILVKNRNRAHGNSFTIENLPQLQERFSNMGVITEVDLNDVPGDDGWKYLIRRVKDALLKLEHIGQPCPATWVAVRHAIDDEPRDIIRWRDFVTLCQEKGMDREGDIRQLGEYLHNLGDVLYFHEDPVLCDYVILKPTWGLDAVYAVLDNETVTSQLGEFSRQDLRTVWADPTYEGYHEQLLRLMQNFQLCYTLPADPDTFIAPQLLTDKTPDYSELDFGDCLQMRYHYPIFMPRGILSRAIVKLHGRIRNQDWVWRYGVILDNGEAQAEILELRGEKQIRIRVRGRNKADLLTEIRLALDELHKGFPKLRVERQIPCNCETCKEDKKPHFFALDQLQRRIERKRTTIECDQSFDDVQIQTLMSDFPAVRMDRAGRIIQAENYYAGDHHEGDRIDVGNVTDVKGLAIGRDADANTA